MQDTDSNPASHTAAKTEARPLPARQPDSSAWMLQSIVTGVLLVGALLVAWGWRRMVIARRAPGASRATTGVESPKELATLRDELRNLSGEIAEELDARAAKLETLIARADQRIAALRSPNENGRAASGYVEAAGASDESQEQPPDASQRMVFELADAGVQTVDIARRVGKPTGQVELILSLRRAARGR